MTLALLIGLCCLPAQAQQGKIRLVLAGDIMLGSDYPSRNLPPKEGRGLLEHASPILQRADLTIGNLEGTIGSGGVSGKNCGSCYAFRSPPHAATRLKEAGFNWWSMANNHARDFGVEGARRTTDWLRKNGMDGSGVIGMPHLQTTLSGRSVCLLAYAPNNGMNDLRDLGKMKSQVSLARKKCHLVVVSFHGGAEGADKTRTPRGPEFYMGENRGDVRAFARGAIDAGAALVFGHGPHVPRGMEIYQDRLIAYSLGNFMTYGGMNVSGTLGLAPLLEVDLNADGTVASGRVHSFRQVPLGAVRLDPRGGALRLIKRKTTEDFNGGGLRFGDDGSFHPSP